MSVCPTSEACDISSLPSSVECVVDGTSCDVGNSADDYDLEETIRSYNKEDCLAACDRAAFASLFACRPSAVSNGAEAAAEVLNGLMCRTGEMAKDKACRSACDSYDSKFEGLGVASGDVLDYSPYVFRSVVSDAFENPSLRHTILSNKGLDILKVRCGSLEDSWIMKKDGTVVKGNSPSKFIVEFQIGTRYEKVHVFRNQWTNKEVPVIKRRAFSMILDKSLSSGTFVIDYPQSHVEIKKETTKKAPETPSSSPAHVHVSPKVKAHVASVLSISSSSFHKNALDAFMVNPSRGISLL